MAEPKTVVKNLAELDDEDIQTLAEKIKSHKNQDDVMENLNNLMQKLNKSSKKKSRSDDDDDDDKPKKKTSSSRGEKSTTKTSKEKSKSSTGKSSRDSKSPNVGDTLLVDNEKREITKIDDAEGKEVKAKIAGKQGKPKGYPLESIRYKRKGVFALKS